MARLRIRVKVGVRARVRVRVGTCCFHVVNVRASTISFSENYGSIPDTGNIHAYVLVIFMNDECHKTAG